MISCRAVCKDYGSFRALSNVSFEVPQGSICALLGPNGAGKSTLVKVLTGLLPLSSGSAEIASLPAGTPALKAQIGILPESLALFELLTVAEHLQLAGSVYQVPSAQVEERIGQLLRLLRLEHGRDTFIQDCSYGMKKKTALAMALLPNPQVLFLDEPFEGIDPVTAESIRVLLRAVAGRGITTLLTSHILSIVDRVADQVVMINHGHIVFDSPVADLPDSLEQLYFEKIERSEGEDLQWLGTAAH